MLIIIYVNKIKDRAICQCDDTVLTEDVLEVRKIGHIAAECNELGLSLNAEN